MSEREKKERERERERERDAYDGGDDFDDVLLSSTHHMRCKCSNSYHSKNASVVFSLLSQPCVDFTVVAL